ncbi:cell envelope integrity protein TolA [Lonepinella sp. BR2882]|uniref:cell envelope integrity protein TolA n=1 Tax=Lonepinella sp. BR2882 TaxID=3095283 RepID=UPI003F6DD1CA
MRNNRQKKQTSALLISVVLHGILFGLLILSSLVYHPLEVMGGGEGDGDMMGAVMVDTGSAAQEWGRIQQQKKGQAEKTKKEPEEVIEKTEPKPTVDEQKLEQQKLEQQRQKQLEQQKAKQEAEAKAKQEALEKAKQEAEAKAKQEAEAAKLKAEAEAKRLAAVAKQAEQEAKAKAEQERIAKEKALQAEKAKAEKEAKEKAEKDAKAKAERDAKEKAEQEAKAKAEREAKEKAEKDAKAKADAKAKQAALDDFLNGGDVGGGSASKGGNANKGGSQGSGAAMGAGDGGKVGDQYAGVIKKEIKRRFIKDPSFAGKVCSIRIQLARDGAILGYQRVSGPDDICAAALSAVARTKKVPAAPSDEIYNKYKNPIIDFDLK